MLTCLNCGAENAPEDRFCGNCGLAVQTAEGHGVVAAARDGAPGGGGDATPGDSAASAPEDETEEPSGGETSAVSAPEGQGTSEEFEPTLIESHGGQQQPQASSGGGAAAAATAASPDSSGLVPPAATDLSGSATLVESTPPRGATTGGHEPGEESPKEAAAAEERVPRATGEVPYAPRTGSTGDSRRASAKQLEPGTILISRYEIVRRIGGGGMGAVYYAKDRNLGDAPRAVKEMIQSQLDESQHEKAVADFKRESMLLASLEHPSIPTIYDYFYDEGSGRFYLVMKYISGGDFLARLRNAPGGRIDELTVTDWGAQVADVLDYLHNRRPQIIYRDLKPANLMIDGNTGRVMLIDFGIARWVSPQEKGVTAVGTMGYAPPELFSGKVEPRSDVYSLGATMFHLLTGADPQDNPLLIFDFTKYPRPRQINPALSNEMERILTRATEHNAEARFRSAAEMREALIMHMERLRSGAVTYGSANLQESGRHDLKTTLSVEMVYCGFCGKTIAGDDVFCAHCGARQPIAAASASVRAARATAKLIVAGTTEMEAGTFPLQKESNLVGRTDPQSNIFPDVDLSRFDPETKISRRHARIWRQGDTFLVEDLGSVNGTVVNDAVKLGPRQPRPLENGDRLRLGETTLHFLIG
ncbi:MAG TPA: protein kinase [Pyrinomonadaceae bacterium]|nr:protein kinase [Pyrinomonadaceae bacterium]